MRLRGITVDTPEPEQLAGFWTEALGYDRRNLWEPYIGLKDPSGKDPLVTIQRSQERPANHLHLDLYSDDPDADVGRLEALGATRVQRFSEGDTWWWVMRDPGGNEFCVIYAEGPERAV
ncbi:MAG: VOC family protein [Acidimicrobiales bacterium]